MNQHRRHVGLIKFCNRSEEKHMKLSLTVVLTVAAMFSIGVAGSAQTPGPDRDGGGGPGFGMHRPPMERALGMHGGRWWNDPALIEKLKLSDDQRKAMDQILLDHREKLVDMRAAVEKAELEMEPLMQDDQPNESRILAQIDKLAQARAELEKANARFLLAIRAKLSPDQWKDLKAARAERMDRHGWREGHGGDRHQAPSAPQAGPGGEPQGM
jgi:protein CpxP